MIHEMRRRLGHAPAPTGGTEGPGFAGVGNDAVRAARIAVNPHETMSQDSTFEERTQVPFHKTGHNPASLPLPLQERFEVPGYRNVVFGTPGTVDRFRFTYCVSQEP